MSGLLLHDAIDASYKSTNDARHSLEKQGYKMDDELSNIEEKVYNNEKTGDLLIAYRGSVNLANDWLDTNISLLKGDLKNSKRFERSKDVYDKAKKKYNKDKVILVGDSLGGSIASAVGNNKDKILTHNKGTSIGNIGNKKNEISYREKGDLVSILNSQNSKTKTLNNGSFLNFGILNPLSAHNYKLLKQKNIFV
jgi:hypothetical protein